MSTNQIGKEERKQPHVEKDLPSWLVLVWQQVETLKFGTVQITVHDSHVTQVERLEKVRLERPR